MKTPSVNETLKNLNSLFRIIGKWQDVADTIGRNRATVNKWFAGTRTPSPDNRILIARVERAVRLR